MAASFCMKKAFVGRWRNYSLNCFAGFKYPSCLRSFEILTMCIKKLNILWFEWRMNQWMKVELAWNSNMNRWKKGWRTQKKKKEIVQWQKFEEHPEFPLFIFCGIVFGIRITLRSLELWALIYLNNSAWTYFSVGMQRQFQLQHLKLIL